MSLAKLSPKAAAESGVEVTILQPTTNIPLGITVTVCGADSETFKNIQRKQLNRRLEKQQKSRTRQTAMTAEELELESMDVLVACTRSWSTGERKQLEFDDNEWLECTPDNVRRVYEALPWLKEQVDQEIGDRANFLQK